MPTPEFELKEDRNFVIITTKYFKLTYIKGKSFIGGKANPSANLKVDLLNTDRYWYYGHPEIRNFGVPNPSLSEGEQKVKDYTLPKVLPVLTIQHPYY